jgi:hypothetical protein
MMSAYQLVTDERVERLKRWGLSTTLVIFFHGENVLLQRTGKLLDKVMAV